MAALSQPRGRIKNPSTPRHAGSCLVCAPHVRPVAQSEGGPPMGAQQGVGREVGLAKGRASARMQGQAMPVGPKHPPPTHPQCSRTPHPPLLAAGVARGPGHGPGLAGCPHGGGHGPPSNAWTSARAADASRGARACWGHASAGQCPPVQAASCVVAHGGIRWEFGGAQVVGLGVGGVRVVGRCLLVSAWGHHGCTLSSTHLAPLAGVAAPPGLGPPPKPAFAIALAHPCRLPGGGPPLGEHAYA